MNKKLIVANWKNHPDTLAQAQDILDFVNDYLSSVNKKDFSLFSLVFCPPFVFIEEVAKILKMSSLEDRSFLGAQDIAIDDKIALTGEISGGMLKKLGVDHIIIGHSERRWKLGESDETVNKKLKLALKDELIPIVCIGEKTRDRDFKNFLKKQINDTFKGLSSEEIAKCIIAYEPVWAISTNPGAYSDTPASALESIFVIRNYLTTYYLLHTTPLFLYGGSVNSKNVSGFLSQKEINGVLVGGASVVKEEFVEILKIASKL